jgi:transposase-like protein
MRKTQSENTGNRRLARETRVEKILQEYRQSGLTQRVIARRAGIGVSTLQLWLRQARLKAGDKAAAERRRPQKENRVSLLEVDVPGWNARRLPEEARYELRLGNGARLRVGERFEDQAVRRLLGLLQEVSRCSL